MPIAQAINRQFDLHPKSFLIRDVYRGYGCSSLAGSAPHIAVPNAVSHVLKYCSNPRLVKIPNNHGSSTQLMGPLIDDERRILEINPAYADFPTIPFGWIYIAIDMRDLRFSKIGLTTKETPSQRIAEGRTYNPFLVLFTTYELAKCTFGISREELRDIEGNIHRRGSVFGPAHRHIDSGLDSEWFSIFPFHAEPHVDWTLARRGFSVEHEALYAIIDDDQSRHGIHIQTMRKIKRIYRPLASDVQQRVEHAGYDARLVAPYLKYLEEFHSLDHPDQIWL